MGSVGGFMPPELVQALMVGDILACLHSFPLPVSSEIWHITLFIMVGNRLHGLNKEKAGNSCLTGNLRRERKNGREWERREVKEAGEIETEM